MSGKGQVIEGSHGLPVARTWTTVYPFRCDDTPKGWKHQLLTLSCFVVSCIAGRASAIRAKLADGVSNAIG